MKKILLLLAFAWAATTVLSAQTPAGRVYGKVLGADTGAALGYASVTLLAADRDSVVGGALTRDNGDFSIAGVPLGRFRLKINYVGYQMAEKTVRVGFATLEQDLGDFYLELSPNALREVEVVAEKERFQMGIDRKVFNVEKDIAAQNGTAVDALKNVPTLTVDADGNAQLRGGTPQIFVDGKPTNLALNQIPAAEIERVEVISNASARFDANATNGIVNLVMKKNSRAGLNGMLNLGVGTNNRYTGMGNLSLRQGRLNASLSYNFNQAGNYNTGFTDRTNFGNDGLVSGYYRQDNANTMKNRFQFGRLGLDWSLDNRRTLSLSQMVMAGQFSIDDPQTFSFSNANAELLSSGTRSSLIDNQMRFYITEVGYRRTYPVAGREWASSVQFGFNHHENETDIDNHFFDNTGAEVVANPAQQRNDGGVDGQMLIVQSDYTLPLDNGAKLEMGIKSQWRYSKSDLDARLYNAETDTWTVSDYLSTHYSYDDWVNAAYVNYSGQLSDTWRYQAGLRFEQSWFRGAQPGTDSTFTYAYPSGWGNLHKALFPALYLSKRFSEGSEMQANFSRKLNRPNFFQVMPFVMVVDNQNYRTGNPNLRPEFVNTAEWNFNHTFGRGSWLVSAYGKYTEQPIAELVRPAEDGTTALLTTFANGDQSVVFGVENTMKINVLKNLSATANVNALHQTIEAEGASNSGWSATTKLNLEYKFAPRWTLQASGQYESPRIIPQGTTRAVYFCDLALRREINARSGVTLTVSDLFNTRRFGQNTSTVYFEQEFSRRRESRYVQLGFSWRFGNPDFSMFKKRRPGDAGGMQGGGDSGY